MLAVPPSDRELDAYREQADRFIAELDEEFYLHYAGLKDTFDLAPIYERHANLTELDQVRSIGMAVNGGARVRELWRFACEGYFGDLTREHAEKLAQLESELQVSVEGDEIPYRMVRPALANEPDRDKRRELDALAEQCRTFLSGTEKLYEDWADRLFRNRVGVSLAEAERWDVPRLFRAP